MFAPFGSGPGGGARLKEANMEYPVVRAKDRPLAGKGYARKVRGLGYLPAVLYGRGMATRPIVVDPKTVVAILNGPRRTNTVIRVEVESGDKTDSCLALIREYSVHPVRRLIEHCDFMAVDADMQMNVKVPIKVEGKSEGEKVGAKLNVALRNIALRCKVTEVPESIIIDVSPLKVGQTLMLSQITLPAGTKPLYPRDMAVVSVRMPRAEKSAAEEAAEAAAAEGAEAAVEGAEGAPAAAEGEVKAGAEVKPGAKGEVKAEPKGKAEAKGKAEPKGKAEAKGKPEGSKK